MYARKDPYQGENPRQVLRKVCDPRTNKRPEIPESMPFKIVDIMKKCWSQDQFFRPDAKELDLLFMDMNMQEAEPVVAKEENTLHRGDKTTKDRLYDIFPRHIADALKAGQKVDPETHEMVSSIERQIFCFWSGGRPI
jgi:hypothetical protein